MCMNLHARRLTKGVISYGLHYSSVYLSVSVCLSVSISMNLFLSIFLSLSRSRTQMRALSLLSSVIRFPAIPQVLDPKSGRSYHLAVNNDEDSQSSSTLKKIATNTTAEAPTGRRRETALNKDKDIRDKKDNNRGANWRAPNIDRTHSFSASASEVN